MRPAAPTPQAFFEHAEEHQAPAARLDESFRELRFKFAGFGGQGILSLGLCVAQAGRLESRYTTWFPSYGPEQRGGSAACSVVVSGKPIGSPAVDHPDVLVCMNQPSYERFAGQVRPGGTVIVDATVPIVAKPPQGVHLVVMRAIGLAQELGVPKAANTMMLAALSRLGVTGLKQEHLLEALDASFKKKPALIEKNRQLFNEAVAWLEKHHLQEK